MPSNGRPRPRPRRPPQNQSGTTASSLGARTSAMSDSPGSLYTTTKPDGSVTLHLWSQHGVNVEASDCSHCLDLGGTYTAIPLSSVVPGSGSVSLSSGASQTQHLCNCEDVEMDLPLFQRLTRANGSFRFEGIEVPMTTAGVGSAVSGQFDKWRLEAKALHTLSRSTWPPAQRETEISNFVGKILSGVNPNPQLDAIVTGYVLADIPLDDPLNLELEERLLTQQAKTTQDENRARQFDALKIQQEGRYLQFVDETGFKPGTNSRRTFVKR